MNISITPDAIIIDGTDKNNQARENILGVCHKYKHLYLDGYPHGKKTRRRLYDKAGIVYQKWEESPKICIMYRLVPDESAGKILIKAFIANLEETSSKYTKRELSLFLQQWQQSVADEVATLVP